MPSHRVSPPAGTKIATNGPFFSQLLASSTNGFRTAVAFSNAPDV
jgi:hypothetical protein